MSISQWDADFRMNGRFQQFGALFVRLCRLIDTALILLCMALTAGPLSMRSAIIDALLCVAVLELTASFFHLSRSWRIVRLRHELADLTAHWTISFLGVMLLFAMLGDLPMARTASWAPAAALWYGGSLIAIILFRIGVRLALRVWRSVGHDQRSAAFIGATETARRLGDVFARQRWMGIRSMGVFDDRRPTNDRTVALPGHDFHGSVDRLYELARSGAVSRIYVTLPMAAEQRIKAILDRFGDTTASLYYCPPLFRLDLVGARWDDVYGQPVVSIVESPFEGYSRLIKRAEDMVLTLIALPLILPIALLAAIAIKIDTRGPVFFSQTRYGLDGRPFRIWKFRSMRVAQDEGFVQARRGDDRVTRVGAVLRRTSIDELPQFINVALGTMSVVGPRPHPVALDDAFRPIIRRYAVRHKIKPGITGLAQVSGWRGETDTHDKMEQRVVHDIDYLRRWSLWLDLQILARTVLVPFVQRNAF
ncbi:undecaprenyl-phosphate glucose phosphotransferase [Sphingobium sp. HWE2-09]|uniref:undecaprenyl-phosphate glucose phosphotransferase n=1 Tax=Sphingobium sp. HWE2-09 TaxID=3108390 RepID=UPI002DC40BF3|nr:undecaprenyl-phosphate glucose phosphotransferase [Sphingobium sp. HWE2-09]